MAAKRAVSSLSNFYAASALLSCYCFSTERRVTEVGILVEMKITFSENQFETHTTVRPIWDLEEMVDKVRRALHEDVDPLLIRQTLIDVLADYEDARILTFVPILACRGAEEKLKKKE